MSSLKEAERDTLPDGWRWAKLGDVCQIIAGQSPPSDTYSKKPEGLPFFQGKADFGRLHPVPRCWCVSPIKIALDGDILFSVRAPVGPTNVANCECCIGRGLAAIRPLSMMDRDYVLFSLKYTEKSIVALGSGSTFQAISTSDLTSCKIPIPPLSEQKRIAAILTEQMQAVERARVAAEAQLQAAKELPTEILRETFGSEEANGWDRRRLGDVLSLRKNVIHPRNEPRGPAIFVGLEHIESGTGIQIGSVAVEMSDLTGRKPQFFKGDIVYGYLRPYLNKVWIAEFDGLCSVDQYVYAVNTLEADTSFVAWYMRSPVYLTRAPIDLTPGQLPRIRTEEVAGVEINLPPLTKQKQIANTLQMQMNKAISTQKALQARLRAINALSAPLLEQAFTGRL